ncbi:S1C family serine protease [Lacipirellula sp.]|uniref:S1C family serine protease n=1 Tax=Lacipirellula sp. TaxID=2691419 RepID=UPI003D113788
MYSLLLLWGVLLVAAGVAAKCRAAGELPASCRIQVRTDERSPEGYQLNSLGSGTLVDVRPATATREAAGLILTCHHVIAGAREIVIEFPNGQTHGALVVQSNEAADLAVLAIKNPKVAPVPLATSFQPGDELIVAGYGGEGLWRAARGRTLINDNVSQVNLVVGTPVRSGDSGGPALNARGQLVGVVWGCNFQQGVTYVTSGRPLNVMLTQFCQPCNPGGSVCGPGGCPGTTQGGIFQGNGGGLFQGNGGGRLIQGADPIPTGPAAQQPAAAACECPPKLDAIDKRLGSIESSLGTFAKRDELANYLRRDEAAQHTPDLSGYVKTSELPAPPDLSNVATRDDVAAIAKQADAEDKTLLEKIKGVAGVAEGAAAAAASGQVGLLQGIGVGKMLAVALGVSGPVGLGIAVAGGLVGRMLKKRLASAGGRSEDAPFRAYENG